MGAVGDTFDASLPGAAPGGLVFVHVFELVDVFALGIVGFTKETAFDQLAHNDIGAHVGVIFGHHIDAAAGTGGFDHTDGFFDGDGSGDLGEDRDVAPEGSDGHGGVVLHGCADDHGIEL